MSNHEQFPVDGNQSAPEQIPHSGVGGHEKPVDEFDNTTLEEAVKQGHLVTPDSPEHDALKDIHSPAQHAKVPTWKKVGAVTAVLAAGAAGAVGMKFAGGDSNSNQPKDRPVAASTPSSEVSADTLTPAELERSTLKPEVANKVMVLPGYYEGNDQDIAYIDQDAVRENLQILLNNITYMQETGDFTAMNNTFLESSDGTYPGADTEVNGVMANAEIFKSQIMANPEQPVSSANVQEIVSIYPSEFETVQVTAEISSITFGAPSPTEVGVAFSTVHTTNYILQAHQVKAEGTDATETAWVILDEEAIS